MKKGFTLIELLAVIVILAIIALIATPMILGVIDDAKQGAAKSSALGYIDGVEKATILAEVSPLSYTAIPTGVYAYNDAALSKVSLKGAKPSAGWVAVGTDGSVVAAELYFSSIHASKYVVYVNNTSTVKTYTSITTPVDGADAGTDAVAEAITAATTAAA